MMRKLYFTILCSLMAVAVVACAYKQLDKNVVICDQPYALCTSAQCIPIPNQPDRSTCFCEVYQGKSMGYLPCNQRVAHTDQFGVQHVTSTFSLEDFSSKKNMTCPEGTPWSNCLDQPCIVDPLNPKQAICSCLITRSGSFQTFGGDCDTSTCDKGYWSGALIEGNAQAVQAMMHALGLVQTPQKFCPK